MTPACSWSKPCPIPSSFWLTVFPLEHLSPAWLVDPSLRIPEAGKWGARLGKLRDSWLCLWEAVWRLR